MNLGSSLEIRRTLRLRPIRGLASVMENTRPVVELKERTGDITPHCVKVLEHLSGQGLIASPATPAHGGDRPS